MIQRTHSPSTESIATIVSIALVCLVLLSAVAPVTARVPAEVGTTTKLDTVSRITGPDGTPLSNDSLWSFEASKHRRATTDENGSFTLSSDGTVGFYQRTSRHYWQRDGVADLHSIKHVRGMIGDLTVPVGHVLDVRVLDADGDPVTGTSVRLSDHAVDSNVSVGIRGETDSNGFYRADDAPVTDLEVAGNVSVVVRPPATDSEDEMQTSSPKTSTETTRATSAVPTSMPPETQDVRSDGQPGFGVAVVVVALVLFVRERQRI